MSPNGPHYATGHSCPVFLCYSILIMKHLYFNGKIYQENINKWGSALLVEDGLIKQVFDKDPGEEESLERVDLKGKFLFPGFEDAHSHPGSRCRMLVELDARDATTWEEARALIFEYVKKYPERQWIVVHGWADSIWGTPSQDQLDELTDKPLMLINVSYHGAIVNRLGEAWLRERPSEMKIEKGLISEADFILAAIETLPALEQLMKLVPEYQHSLALMGTTGVHDLHIATEDQLLAHQSLALRGELPLFTVGYINSILINSPVVKELLQNPLEKFQIKGLKLFLDGAIGLRTARVFEAYHDTGERGELRYSKDEALEIIELALKNGLTSVAIHAIGDEAVSQTLDVYEAMHEKGVSVIGWRIEHAEIIQLEDIDRMKRLGVVPVMQPNFHWDLEYYHDRLSQAQMERINPFAELIDAGVELTFGSDGMPEGALVGLDYAMNNTKFDTQIVDLQTAIKAYTVAGPLLVGASDRGRLRAGFVFNAVLFEENLFEAAVLSDVSIAQVWISGKTFI